MKECVFLLGGGRQETYLVIYVFMFQLVALDVITVGVAF